MRLSARARRSAAPAGGAGPRPAAVEAAEVYLLGQVVPVRAGAARPWLRAGPIRAWSFDFGIRG